MRPEKVWRDEMIVIEGVKIYLTPEGVKYMLDHYEHMQRITRSDQIDNETRLHVAQRIVDYKLQIHLYEKSNTG